MSIRGGTSYYGIWISGTWTHRIDVGTFTASMWASDGTTRESVPITIVVNATGCRHY